MAKNFNWTCINSNSSLFNLSNKSPRNMGYCCLRPNKGRGNNPCISYGSYPSNLRNNGFKEIIKQRT